MTPDSGIKNHHSIQLYKSKVKHCKVHWTDVQYEHTKNRNPGINTGQSLCSIHIISSTQVRLSTKARVSLVHKLFFGNCTSLGDPCGTIHSNRKWVTNAEVEHKDKPGRFGGWEELGRENILLGIRLSCSGLERCPLWSEWSRDACKSSYVNITKKQSWKGI